MPKPKMNILNKRFGRWLVISEAESDKNKQSRWVCQCDCGTIKAVLGNQLKKGASNSCGCLRTEVVIQRSTTHRSSYKENRTDVYSIWLMMKYRCSCEKANAYHRYGGRGIKVCEKWINSFENFRDDMGPRPSKSHSLDRYPNMNGNYEPSNCRWATKKEQSANTCTTVRIEYGDKKMTLREWASFFNVKFERFRYYYYKLSSFVKVINVLNLTKPS